MNEQHIQHHGNYYNFVVENGWEYIDPAGFRDVVIIIPITDDDNLLLVEQYRVPVSSSVLELPAGLVGDIAGKETEGILEAAGRELIEETGYRASTMKIVTEATPSAGSNSLAVKMVLATDLQKVGPGGGDETENITVHKIPIAELPAYLERRRNEGTVIDMKIYAGLWFVDRHLRNRDEPR